MHTLMPSVFQHGADVVAPELVEGPAPAGGVDQLLGDLLGDPLDGRKRSQPQPAHDQPEPGELDPLMPASPEVTARGAQHQAIDPPGVAVPHELSDRPAHRVADGDEGVDGQMIGDGNDVVGTGVEAEGIRGAQTPPVPSVIERHDAELATERAKGGEPVEPPGRGQTVQEDDRRRSPRPAELTDEGRSPAR